MTLQSFGARSKSQKKTFASLLVIVGVVPLIVGAVTGYLGLAIILVVMTLGLFGGCITYTAKKGVSFGGGKPRRTVPHHGVPVEDKKKEKDWSRIKRETYEVIEKFDDFIGCLVFVAKADGQMRDKEREVISEALRYLCPNKEILHGHVDWYLKEEIRKLTTEEFEEGLARISQLGESVKIIFQRAAKDIIGTQKTICPGEKYCLMAIEKAIG